MRLLVTGDRDWTDEDRIRRVLRMLMPTTVIHGASRGADKMAENVAIEMGIPVEAYPAYWRKYGRAAGPIRNKEMIEAHPDLVVAFHDNLDESKGTADCVNRAIKAGIPVCVCVRKDG